MIDQQELIKRIDERLKARGHNHPTGCVVCLSASMLVTALADNANLRIEALLKSWGHNRAPGCVVCDTVLMLVEDDADVRVIGGVTVTGPKS